MVVLREQGVSLDAIAGRFEVSRERVRQILRAHGGPSPQDIADARRQRTEQLAQAHVDELLARWRAGEQPDRAAAKLGLQIAACRSRIERFATDADRAARTASMTGAHGARTYSDRDIILALRGATARLGRVPIAKEYDAVARDRQLPSLPTVLNRMGGWSNALAAAELRPRAAPGRTRRRRWTQKPAGRRCDARSTNSTRSRRSAPTSASPPTAKTCRPPRPSATGWAAGAR